MQLALVSCFSQFEVGEYLQSESVGSSYLRVPSVGECVDAVTVKTFDLFVAFDCGKGGFGKFPEQVVFHIADLSDASEIIASPDDESFLAAAIPMCGNAGLGQNVGAVGVAVAGFPGRETAVCTLAGSYAYQLGDCFDINTSDTPKKSGIVVSCDEFHTHRRVAPDRWLASGSLDL